MVAFWLQTVRKKRGRGGRKEKKKKKKDKHTYTTYIPQTVFVAYGNVTSEITEVHLKILWLQKEMGCLLVEDQKCMKTAMLGVT